MGVVLAAWDSVLGREVALKLLRPELASDDRARTRFRREARIAARLQHPSIAPVFDVSDQGDGVLFYSMKLVRGRTLAWALEAASERVPELLEVFLRVCQGMAHAHDSGVVHRDLKPSNVMCGEWGEVQIIDWGLAKELDADDPDVADFLVATGAQPVGTPGFMAPEQALEGGSVGAAADVYSLGRLLDHMLRGDRTPELRALVTACTELSPTARPAHAGEVADAISDYLAGAEGRVIEARAEARAAIHRANAERRSRRVAVVAGCGIGVAIAISAYAVWSGIAARDARQRESSKAVRHALDEASAELDRARRVGGEHGLLDLEVTRSLHAARGRLAAAEPLLGDAAQPDLSAQWSRASSAATRMGASQHMLKELAAIRDRFSLHLLSSVQAKEYGAAYHAHGIEPGAHETAVATLRASPIHEDLIVGLLAWDRALRRGRGSEATRAAIRSLLDSADRDPWRIAMRNALVGPNLDALDKLCSPASLETASIPSLVFLGNSLVDLSQKALAIRVLTRATEVAPASFDAQLALGVAHAAPPNANADAAVIAYRCAIAIEPKSAVAWVDLGNVLGATDPAAARRCYERAIRAQPGVATGHYHLGLHFDTRGEPERAIECYRRCTNAYPLAAEAHFNRGRIHLNRGEFAQAIEANRAAIAIRPKHYRAISHLGLAIQCSQGHRAAIATHAQAADLGWHRFETHRNLGHSLAKIGRHADAAVALRDAHEVAPSPIEFGSWRIRQLEAAGDHQRAALLWWRLVALDPNSRVLRTCVPSSVLGPGEDCGARIAAVMRGAGEHFDRLPAPTRARVLYANAHGKRALDVWTAWLESRESVPEEDLLDAALEAHALGETRTRDAWVERAIDQLERQGDAAAARAARIWDHKTRDWKLQKEFRNRVSKLARAARSLRTP